MVRLGFFLGFLIGGGIASLLLRSRDEEASALVTDRPPEAGKSKHPVVDRIAQQFNEAQSAAHAAQLEKEAEMRRLYEDLVHRPEAPRL